MDIKENEYMHDLSIIRNRIIILDTEVTWKTENDRIIISAREMMNAL